MGGFRHVDLKARGKLAGFRPKKGMLTQQDLLVLMFVCLCMGFWPQRRQCLRVCDNEERRLPAVIGIHQDMKT